MKRFFIYLVALLSYYGLHCQDVQLSQYYNVPAYLNPSMVGMGAENVKILSHSRFQWTGLDAKSFTTYLGMEKMWEEKNSSFGVLFSQDNQGGLSMTTSEVHLQYAYNVYINDHERLSFGIDAGIANRKLGNDLIFPDEYTSNGFTGSGSVDELQGLSILYPDFGAGAIFYSKHFWIGASAFHLNRPNQSFLGDNAPLPMRFDFHAGYKFDLSETKFNKLHTDKMDRSIYPVFSYKAQGNSDQLELGLYGKYDIFIAGFLYRGIPSKKYDNYFRNHESLIFVAGIKHHNIHINYSYDAVISKLSGYARGAHELNLTVVPVFTRKGYKMPKPMKRLPCPAPMQF